MTIDTRSLVWSFIRHLNRLMRAGRLDEAIELAANAVHPDRTLPEIDEAFLKMKDLLGES